MQGEYRKTGRPGEGMSPKCIICDGPVTRYLGPLWDKLYGVEVTTHLVRCTRRDCNHVSVFPMPDEAEIAGYYSEYSTHHITSMPVRWWRRLYWSMLDFVLIWDCFAWQREDLAYCSLHKFSRGKVLDFGCGSGQLMKRLGELGWDECEGFDFDEKALKVARSCLPNSRLHYSFQTLLSSGNMYDYIILNHVLEHLADPLAGLGQLMHLLAPGGKIIVRTPNSKSFLARLLRTSWRGLEPPRHLNLFTIESLRCLCKRLNLEDVHIYTSNAMFQGVYAGTTLVHYNRIKGVQPFLAWGLRLSSPAVLFLASIVRKVFGHTGEELVGIFSVGPWANAADRRVRE